MRIRDIFALIDSALIYSLKIFLISNLPFRKDWLTPVASYAYGDYDQFERPPYVVHFKSDRIGEKLFFILKKLLQKFLSK